MAQSLRANFPNVNVLIYTWPDANVPVTEIGDAAGKTMSVGLDLGLKLAALGVHDMQFIGHSLGNYINAYATEFLIGRGVNVDQVILCSQRSPPLKRIAQIALGRQKILQGIENSSESVRALPFP